MHERIGLIQEIINKLKAETYLEIGVWQGACFLKIKCPKKIALDPKLDIPKHKKQYKSFEMTSDEFFRKKKKFLTKKTLDVVFIDGLHTYEQVLKDVLNSLKYLNKKGVIVIHDCNPPYASAAIPEKEKMEYLQRSEEIPGWTGDWCGDVWKSIVHLRSIRDELKIFVIDFDWGVGIITFGQPENLLKFTEGEIKNLTYNDLDKNREKFLNLKDPSYISTFIKTLEKIH